MESFWKKKLFYILDGSVLCDENTTIIIESDLDTEFFGLWTLDLPYKRKDL